MENKLTPLDAWNDFYSQAKKNKVLPTLPESERKRIYEANAAAKGQREYPLGPDRIVDILGKYAPDTYQYFEGDPYFLKAGF